MTCCFRIRSLIVLGLMLAPVAASARAAEQGSSALTIYSTAQPGGIPAEIYQPGMQPSYSAAQYRQVIPVTPS